MIRKTSVQLGISEDWVDRVVAHQWRTTLESLEGNTAIEVSGLGKFKARYTKVVSKLKLYRGQERYLIRELDSATTEKQKRGLGFRLENCRSIINHLEKKLEQLNNELSNRSDNRGVAESSGTSQEDEGSDK